MHAFASLNQKILLPGEAKLPAISSAAFYGKGIFTTVAIYRAKPFLWEKHWRRLNENAAAIGIDLSAFREEKVKSALVEIIEKNGLGSGRARITFFDETAGGVWSIEASRKPSLLIATADFREAKVLNLTVSPYRKSASSPLSNVKSCNYLENILALDGAKKSGFDEAARLNERGEIASACLANLFWIKDGLIFTPPLETGCLAGTTREFLIENFPIEEKRAAAEELNDADEIFLTSAGIGVRGVSSFNKKILENSITHDIERKFRSAASV
jgi:branched-subunit amino acid aminotransferase/4-amino-4-deoxychorismate lyase